MSMTAVTGIQGQLLDVTVVGCSRLKDTEWISRQDPYVCLEYATTKFRSRTCTDGGKNPVFQEKTIIPLIEGLREISITVWNSNTLTFDDYIGSGRVQLNKVLSQGYDDSSWPIQSKSGRYAGEVKLIMHYANAQANAYSQKSATPVASYMAPSAAMPPYGQPNPYAQPAPARMTAAPYPPMGGYQSTYPSSYPPVNPDPYSTSAYPPPPLMQQGYPAQPYPPPTYPQQTYPPPPPYQSSYPPVPYPYPPPY